MRLRTKFALVLLAVLAVLTAANVAALSLYQDEIEDRTQRNVQETANATADQIQKSLRDSEDRVSARAQKHPRPQQLATSEPYLEQAFRTSKFWGALVVAKNGTVVAVWGDYSNPQAVLGQNVSNESFFRRVMNRRTTAITGPRTAGNRNKSYLSFSAPIREGTNLTGVLIAHQWIDNTTVLSPVRPLERDDQAVTVTDRNGSRMYAPLSTFDETINGSATAEQDAVKWSVTVTRDRAPLERQLEQLAILQAVSLLVVFGAVIGFGVWEYRSNLQQTERLLEGFRRIGEGDYEYRLDLASAQEWRQIGDGFNDLTMELSQREAELREREQRLEVLNRVLRHNVRNEMSIILNYSEIVQNQSDDDLARDAAGTIVGAARELSDLSEKARQVEQAVESADDGLVEQDIVELVNGVIEDLEADYPDANISVEGPDVMTVSAIRSLAMAVENLIENAVVHNDSDEPTVVISIDEVDREDQQRVLVKFADNGPGIPEQEKNVLMQGRETPLEHGSGLGLWLVYWVVDKSDGHLEFDENDPRGSIVTMDLHASLPEDIQPTAPVEPSPEAEAAADD